MSKLRVQNGDLRKSLAKSRLSKALEEREKASEAKFTSIVKATKDGSLLELRALLSQSPDFDINSSVSEGGVTLLHLAARFNHVETLEFLLSREGINIDAQAQAGATALFNAAITGSFESTKILLEAGANPLIASIQKDTPLHVAAANGYTNIAELLIAYHSNINAKTVAGDTPLHLATRYVKEFTAELLLSYKADQKITNNLGETPLVSVLKTAKKSMDDLVMKYSRLIAHMSIKGSVKLIVQLPNGKISETDRELETCFKNPEELLKFIREPQEKYTDLSIYAVPLKIFADKLTKGLREHSPYLTDEKIASICTLEMIKYIGFSETIKVHENQEKQIATWFEMIKFLVKNGADLTTPDSDENYPITLAADLGFSEIVKMLHDKGVSLEPRDKLGKTALIKALERDHHIFKVLSNYSITQRIYVETESTIDYLIENCKDLGLLDSNRNSALFHAAYAGHKEAVRKMLEFDFDVDTKNIEGITPLLGALHKGNKEIVQLLLEARADYNVADDKGISPIHIATTLGLTNIINLLLEAGANIDQKVSGKGTTALMIALFTKRHEVIKLLIERGADKFAKDSLASTIHVACKSGLTDIVKLIVSERPEEINCLSTNGNAPIHIAASNGHIDLIRYLLANGADNRMNSDGKTPLVLFNLNKSIPLDVKKAVIELFLGAPVHKEAEHEDDVGSSAGSAASTIAADAHEELLVTGASSEKDIDVLS